jgi:uncharacterized protein (DUF2267 family)
MSATGLEVFDKTLQITNIWLKELSGDLGCTRRMAWNALGGVLAALRDRLPPPLSAHLSAELPLLVRGLYFEGWHPNPRALRQRSLDEFLAHVAVRMDRSPIDAADACAGVFLVLDRHLAPGLAQKVYDALPDQVRDLWPESEWEVDFESDFDVEGRKMPRPETPRYY